MSNLISLNTERHSANSDSFNLQQYQFLAIVLIEKSAVGVAQLIEIGSETVWRWQNHNPEFAIAKIALRTAVWADSVERLRKLTALALTLVEKEIAKADKEVAISLLQVLGKKYSGRKSAVNSQFNYLNLIKHKAASRKIGTENIASGYFYILKYSLNTQVDTAHFLVPTGVKR